MQTSHSDAAPPELLCPITQEVMRDPVVTADGHTYERAAIERWLHERRTSPLTGAPLQHRNLTPNILAKQLCDAWREKHPDADRAEDADAPAPQPEARAPVSARAQRPVEVPPANPQPVVEQQRRAEQAARTPAPAQPLRDEAAILNEIERNEADRRR